MLDGTVGYYRVLQGTPGALQGTAGVLRGTPGVLRGYCGVLRGYCRALRGTAGYSQGCCGGTAGSARTQEQLGGGAVLRHDRVGVVRADAVDVLHRLEQLPTQAQRMNETASNRNKRETAAASADALGRHGMAQRSMRYESATRRTRALKPKRGAEHGAAFGVGWAPVVECAHRSPGADARAGGAPVPVQMWMG